MPVLVIAIALRRSTRISSWLFAIPVVHSRDVLSPCLAPTYWSFICLCTLVFQWWDTESGSPLDWMCRASRSLERAK